jgi:pescadillo protein
MGKKTKKGTKGQATLFLSRKRAMRRLGLNLKDFRRICILKGVFPRQPNRKLDKAHRTYYHIKDIRYLESDKLVDHFAQEKIFKRKLTKAIAKKDKLRIRRLKAGKPELNVDHVIRQRYPRFEQALKDMSDPLSLLSLISGFPGHRLYRIPPQKTRAYKLLMDMFKALVVKKKLLSKVFLATKGVYYEAMLGSNIPVVWIEPYESTAVLPVDVDYKMLLTFSEFHSSLLKFVMARLYKLSRLQFPPSFKNQSLSPTFGDFSLVEVQEESTEEMVDKEFREDETLRKMIDWNGNKKTDLFKGLVFFLSREVRKSIFEFIARSYGAITIVSEDNFDSEEYKDQKITHVITDRRLENIKDKEKYPNREVVQPQWICDSINFNHLLNVRDYLPGSSLPPHLSPFESSQREGFLPQRKKEIMEQMGEEVPEYSEVSDLEIEEEDEEEEKEKAEEIIEESENESELEEDSGSEGEESKTPVEATYTKQQKLKRNRLNVKKDLAYEVEEEKFDKKKEERQKKLKEKKKAQEGKELAAMQLSRKKRKIYDQLQKSKNVSKAEVRQLKKKQKKLFGKKQ